MDTYNTTTRYILIFLLLTGFIFGVTALFTPISFSNLWGLQPFPIADIKPETLALLIPGYGIFILGIVSLNMYVLVNGSKTALHALLAYNFAYWSLALIFGILAFTMMGMPLTLWMALQAIYLLINIYLWATNR